MVFHRIMDFKEIMKFNMISGSMGGAGGGNRMDGKSLMSDPMGMIWQVLFMIAIGFADELTKLVPMVISSLKEKYITNFLQKRITDKLDNSPVPIKDLAVPLDKKHFVNTVSMSRVYAKDSASLDRAEEMNSMIDAVLDSVARLSNVPSFRLIESAQTMISYKECPIQLTKDIYLRLDAISVTPEGTVEKIDITLSSNTLSASEISKHVRYLHELRKEELKNALGDTIYFFDQKSKDGVPSLNNMNLTTPEQTRNARTMQVNTAPKQLSFTKTPFYSNKTFANISGDEVRLIEKRVKFFINNKDWYDSRGVPYQLGLLLSGTPGTGKTSVIRAIANQTKRHIINVNFANVTTATQLKNLFFNEKVSVYTDATMAEVHSYLIPIDQRIYVLEEIDAVSDIVKQRRPGVAQVQSVPDELTLGEILTVLDGTMESPGRIVIMTSNHPETLDAALIRPGRIDVAVNFKNATLKQISEMYTAFYDNPLDIEKIPECLDGQLSPAEVGQVLFRHFDELCETAVIEDLCCTVEKKQATDRERAAYFIKLDTPTTESEETKEDDPTDTLQEKMTDSPNPETTPGGGDLKQRLPTQVFNNEASQYMTTPTTTTPTSNFVKLGGKYAPRPQSYVDTGSNLVSVYETNDKYHDKNDKPWEPSKQTNIGPQTDSISKYSSLQDADVTLDMEVTDVEGASSSLDNFFQPSLIGPSEPICVN